MRPFLPSCRRMQAVDCNKIYIIFAYKIANIFTNINSFNFVPLLAQKGNPPKRVSFLVNAQTTLNACQRAQTLLCPAATCKSAAGRLLHGIHGGLPIRPPTHGLAIRRATGPSLEISRLMTALSRCMSCLPEWLSFSQSFSKERE